MDRKYFGKKPSRFTNETLGLLQQLKITLNEDGQKRNWQSLRLTNDTIGYIATTLKGNGQNKIWKKKPQDSLME